MKNLNQALLIILFVLTVRVAGQSEGGFIRSNSAYTLPQGRWETGVFQALRYGCSPDLEISLHPVWFFILPNGSVKWSHGVHRGWQISSRHGFFCPTWTLRLIAKKGIAGILSPEFEVPFLLGLNQQLLLSKAVAAQWTVTWNGGIGVGLKSGSLDSRTTIDLPVIYPRMSMFYHRYHFYTGVDLAGPAVKRWRWLAAVQLFFCPQDQAGFAFEHKGLLLWSRSSRFQLCGGYKLIYGEYPFGHQWHLLPVLDVQWGWH